MENIQINDFEKDNDLNYIPTIFDKNYLNWLKMNYQPEFKVGLITGGTSGIGQATAFRLAKLGFKLIITGRNQKRGEETVIRLNKISNKLNGLKHEFYNVDFSSLSAIITFCNTIQENYSQLHILINNAGIITFKKQITKYGVELAFAINHLAHFLLTHLLLDLIKNSAPATIINVSSVVHRGKKLNIDGIWGKEVLSGVGAYSHSKLANVLFTYKLSELLKDTKVTVNAMHPGTIRTRIGRNYPLGLGLLWKFIPFFRSSNKGAETIIYLATSPDVENITGKYFVNKKAIKSSSESYKKNKQDELWNFSMEMTLKNPNLSEM